VHGEYFGIPYTGIVTHQRPHTMNHHIQMFSVQLDAPLTVFGLERNSLLINASDDPAALAHFLGHAPDTTPIAPEPTRVQPEAWRLYRDPLSVKAPPCATCEKPVPDAYAMLADATRFCSAACYEHYVRR
jgi:hypothetical protein